MTYCVLQWSDREILYTHGPFGSAEECKEYVGKTTDGVPGGWIGETAWKGKGNASWLCFTIHRLQIPGKY